MNLAYVKYGSTFVCCLFVKPPRWPIWNVQVITSQSKTTKWSNCTHLQFWTTSQSGFFTTNLCSPPKTTSALAQTSNQSGMCAGILPVHGQKEKCS